MQNMDRQALEEARTRGWIDGAACVSAWVVGDTCCVANLGTCVCIPKAVSASAPAMRHVHSLSLLRVAPESGR